MAEKKNPVKSKTMRFAAMLAVLGAVQVALPGVREQIPADWFGWITMAVGIIVAYLRYVTSQPVR